MAKNKAGAISNRPKIGYDWTIVKDRNGRLYARSPKGQLVRVTQDIVAEEVRDMIHKFGPYKRES